MDNDSSKPRFRDYFLVGMIAGTAYSLWRNPGSCCCCLVLLVVMAVALAAVAVMTILVMLKFIIIVVVVFALALVGANWLAADLRRRREGR